MFDYHRRVETGAKFNRHVSLHQYKVPEPFDYERAKRANKMHGKKGGYLARMQHASVNR